MAANLEGFAQRFPDRIADSLARTLGRLDADALAEFELVLPDALRGRNPQAMERALEQVQLELPPPNTAAIIAAGAAVNRINRTRFFRALARRLRVKLVNTDEPGGPLTSTGEGKVGVVQPNLNPELFVDQFVNNTVARAGILGAGIVEATRRAIIRDVFLGEGDPEELTQRMLGQWRDDGVPSQISTNMRTAAGFPVDVNVEAHSAFVARDAIGTLQMELTRNRQTAAGIERFVWVTRGDSKVRPEHAARNGKVFTWAEGADGEFPGGPPNCRCHARAVLPSMEALRATLIAA